ncbi:hypothetical protein OCA8868_03108 [Octadecabacter ascidiaceicola]|uniref:Uncharacterized protein n=1 Tax=Octadecabacter ascidiaceicola TaxID=1655543 RepID=A0A238KQ91_9RHOB|nr:hypothetical protein OCA8868_03108 [Octadecabacter ascidiaceicola]
MFLSSTLKKCTILAVLSLSACVAPTDPKSTQQITTAPAARNALVVDSGSNVSNPIVTANFRGGGGSWEGTGSILFRYVAIERNGEIHVCGAYTAQGSNNIRRLSREVMQAASVSANGETIMRNMRFFREASSATMSRRLVGIETSCRSTGRASGTVALETLIVQTRSGRYRVDG